MNPDVDQRFIQLNELSSKKCSRKNVGENLESGAKPEVSKHSTSGSAETNQGKKVKIQEVIVEGRGSAETNSEGQAPSNAITEENYGGEGARAQAFLSDEVTNSEEDSESCWTRFKKKIRKGIDSILIPQEEKDNKPPSGLRYLALGILLYVGDIISDIASTVDYYQRGKFNYFLITLIFIIVPTVLGTLYNVFLFWEERKSKISVGRWIVRGLFVFVGPLTRSIEAFYYARKCRNAFGEKNIAKATNNKNAFVKLRAEASALKLFEAFLEAAPQATLNIYILIMDFKQAKPASSWQIAKLCTSVASLASSVASFNRISMVYVGNKRNIAYIGSGIETLGNVCIFLSRVVALGLFASVSSTTTTVLVCVVNWIVMTVFACILKDFFDSFNCNKESFWKLFLNVGIGWIFCFVFHNLTEGKHPRRTHLRYYTFCFLGNTLFLYSWFSWSIQIKDSSRWDLEMRWLFITGNYLLYFVGLLLFAMYRFNYHPTGGVVPFPENFNARPRPKKQNPPVKLTREQSQLDVNGIMDLTMTQVYNFRTDLYLIKNLLDFFISEFHKPDHYKSFDGLKQIGEHIVEKLRELNQFFKPLNNQLGSHQFKEEVELHHVQSNLKRGTISNERSFCGQLVEDFGLTGKQVAQLQRKTAELTDYFQQLEKVRNKEPQDEITMVIIEASGERVWRLIEDLDGMITQFQIEFASSQSSGDNFQRNGALRREQNPAGKDGGNNLASANGSGVTLQSQSEPLPGPSRRISSNEILNFSSARNSADQGSCSESD